MILFHLTNESNSLSRREVLEEGNDLDPRVSVLEEDLDDDDDEDDDDDSGEEERESSVRAKESSSSTSRRRDEDRDKKRRRSRSRYDQERRIARQTISSLIS